MRADQAKQIHLGELLAKLGHRPVPKDGGESWYLSPFRDESKASFKITSDGKAWYDHGAGVGGNILDFVIYYPKRPFEDARDIPGALRALDLYYGSPSVASEQASKQHDAWKDAAPGAEVRQTDVPAGPEPARKPILEITKIQPLQNQALIQYLNRRGIDAATAGAYLQEAYYRWQGKKFFALAFANESGGYELRNPYFQGSYAVKDISLIKPDSEGQGTAVALFEGFMDFLSALVYTQKPASSLPVIVLNSASMRHRALTVIQERGYTELHLYFDHDKTGRDLTEWFQAQLPDRFVHDQSKLYGGYKDFNEWLMGEGASAGRGR